MSKALATMNKPVQIKTFPVILPIDSELELVVIDVQLSSGMVKVPMMPVNVLGKIHPEWHEFFLGGINFNNRLRMTFALNYAVGFDPRPLPDEVFNVFEMAISKIKVVIVGQDPYPSLDQSSKRPIACGYSFATMAQKTPDSLLRIRSSISKSNNISITITDKEYPNSLKGWKDQGVFLMNNTPIYFGKGSLGYSSDEDNAEIKRVRKDARDAWRGITELICKHIISKNPSVRFILMGSEAEYLRQHISKVVTCSHPSTRSSCEFTGRCFEEVNEFKGLSDDQLINWAMM